MTLLAINALLEPDAATVRKAQATNARLRESFPDSFALNAHNSSRRTFLQRFVQKADLDGGAISRPTVDYANNFVGSRTGMNDHRHRTVDIGTREYALKAEPFETFTVQAISMSLYKVMN